MTYYRLLSDLHTIVYEELYFNQIDLGQCIYQSQRKKDNK